MDSNFVQLILYPDHLEYDFFVSIKWGVEFNGSFTSIKISSTYNNNLCSFQVIKNMNIQNLNISKNINV